ncbi:Uncharacterized protein TCAP_07086 [Tolypocladium capitatum]|uniref:Karyogamy protein, KAR9 n=1 Tax=Tolypocladium capitatum TaxID=45235 RepID=A0A2K3Q595_9HYPO|nr:Uncharacterized protein TCAP_07086 [Tolypocladium capitatum]
MTACADHPPAVIAPSFINSTTGSSLGRDGVGSESAAGLLRHHLHGGRIDYDDDEHRQDAVGQVLTFADIPSDISQLRVPRGATSAAPRGAAAPTNISFKVNNPTTANVAAAAAAAAAADGLDPTDTPALSRTAAANNNNNNTSRSTRDGSSTAPAHNSHAPPVPPPPQHHHLPASAIRKTSPGLAARLKALGFGSPKQPSDSATPHHDRVGRLDEQQLRQLDEKHQAGSLTSVISRRGRPWKGSGAATWSSTSPNPAARPVAARPVAAAESPQLPEIKTPEPLAMDTQKYRLPDHTNGNGTKVTLDTRREHLERTTRPSPDAVPPPPPPPEESAPAAVSPPAVASPNDYVPGLSSYFTPGHARSGSIYTLSRASFANQLAQLTSLQLPDAESLSSKVSAIRTAQVAVKALINAAEQIRSWICKAQEVIGGLDSDDDVEWAAAGGREGLEEVENAIVRFEELINVYVGAIEELQGRGDISSVAAEDLTRAVSQMECIIDEWAKIRTTLHTVRAQVEIAMEWEELWNNVLGDIQGEMDELSRLVFEMEERRHKSIVAAAGGDNVDIADLETIVEDSPVPASRRQAPNRFSLPPLPVSPSSPGTPGLSQDDSSLLALFARMQPLRASLDFLPMRLSVFEARAERSFPTACDELEMRRTALDASYKKLEKDAESLRKELGEDRWVIVFRGAGRQAQKMHESVQRSLLKLREAVDAGLHLTSPPTMSKKMESYEAKKTHYGPAVERVLSIIDRGVKDRLTVNGEILRLHSDMQSRWDFLKNQMRDMDAILEDIQMDRRSQQLRDSISSLLSNDRSTIGSGHDTPGSSPPSSVIMSSLGFDPHTPVVRAKGRPPGAGNSAPHPVNRRHSSLPAPASQSARKTGSRLSTIASSPTTSPLASSFRTPRPGSTLGNRPAWNGSTNVTTLDTGHNFTPLTLTTPSPYAKDTPGTQRSVSALSPSSGGSRLPTLRNPPIRASSESPKVIQTPSRTSHSRLSFRERLASPGPYSQQALSKQRPSAQSSMSVPLTNRRVSMQPSGSESTVEGQTSRPASSLASTSRRSSMLPMPKGTKEGSTGLASPQLATANRAGMRKTTPMELKDLRPKWRH